MEFVGKDKKLTIESADKPQRKGEMGTEECGIKQERLAVESEVGELQGTGEKGRILLAGKRCQQPCHVGTYSLGNFECALEHWSFVSLIKPWVPQGVSLFPSSGPSRVH